ncbi:GNAT family N-acetyltransferase [Promethearchaeum syntrophicum]|uniref:GNAT family N-acetyltransferase n=1 Tax=Promethearchaeum syntrophicum TaxID=2594042 RepID=A0A5B9D9Q7_9ARCH|nr:GNAT family N-acetyltransferase [Candidatus Prometheoarchaeum syntrophicum]QEE15567.1 Acetyltransferase (GNAT) family protein [Candidatus Prometheoarchaeum syntrophicum]
MLFPHPKGTIQLIKDIDLDQMKEIWNQNYCFLSSTGRIHTTETINDWFENRHTDFHEYYGYFIDSILVGFIIIRNPKKSLWIKFLAVKISSQSQGVGKALLDFIINNSENKQKFTECFIDNIKALNFFKRYGFKIVKVDSDYNEYTLEYE